MAEPGGEKRVRAVVQPGPDRAADRDGGGEEPGERGGPAEVMAEDEDVMGGEAEAGDGDGQRQFAAAGELAEDEPPPVVLFEEGVDQGVEEGQEQVGGERVNAEPM